MTFDNTPARSPSRWTIAKDHIPLVLTVAGFAGLFISFHAAAYTIAGIATGHMLLGITLFTVQAFRNRTGVNQ